MDLLNGFSNSSDICDAVSCFYISIRITFLTDNCFADAVPENSIKRHNKIINIFDLFIFSPHGKILYLPNLRYNCASRTPIEAIITQSLMLESSGSRSIFCGSSLYIFVKCGTIHGFKILAIRFFCYLLQRCLIKFSILGTSSPVITKDDFFIRSYSHGIDLDIIRLCI